MKLLLALAVAAALAACGETIPKAPVAIGPVTQEPIQVMGAGAGDSLADTHIVAAIQHALQADDELSQFVVDVDSKDGYVVLSGVAASEAARERATAIARSLPQVSDIANQLTLKQA